MSGWDEFLDTLDLNALVPETYARYRPAVVEGLAFFLENLDPSRTWDLLAEQAAFPDGTAVAERLVAIARHCPALHKLGQVLARDRRLPEDLRQLLQRLETMPSALGVTAARALVEAEIGPLSVCRVQINEPPLAEASVAVVIPFTAPAAALGIGEMDSTADGVGRAPATVRGVCKLLKPGIEAKLEEELDLLQRIGGLLDERCDAYSLPPIEYEETFLQVRCLLAREVHLDHEQANMRAARVAYASLSSVVIPEVYVLSTPRMTVMQRIDGTKVTDGASLTAPIRRKLANTLVRAMIAQPLWAPGEESLFHADPHAGNLFATPEGRLGIVDWSLVGRLTKADRIALTQILLGALTMDGERIERAIASLSQWRADQSALSQVVADRVASLQRGAWPGMSWLMEMVDEAATQARCRFPGDLVVFRKVMKTLDGVIGDVCGSCRADRVLITALLRQLAAEWGERAFTLPFSRHFATHFSNLDLTQLLMSAPLIGSRQWLGVQSKLLARGGSRAG